MKAKLRLPNITGKSDKEKIEQLTAYLRYLVTELQWLFDSANETKEGQEEK